MNPSVRAAITFHRATYTLGGGDGRTREVGVAVVRRQVLRGSGRWRTTRAHRIDAGAGTSIAAHQVAMAISPEVIRSEVSHGDLGTYDLNVDAERAAFLSAVAAVGCSSERLPVYDATDATGRGSTTFGLDA